MKEKGYKKQAQLAKSAGISRTHLNQILNGTKQPSMEVANNICKALGYDMDPIGLFKEESNDQGKKA